MTTYHLRCAIRNLSKGLVESYSGVILQKWRKVLMPRCLPLSGCNRAKFHSFLSSIGGLLLQQLCCLDHSDVTAFFPVSTSSNSILHWISSLFIDCLCGRYYIAFRQAITNKHFFFQNPAPCHRIWSIEFPFNTLEWLRPALFWNEW